MTFQEALDWTDRKVIFASGSPFQPISFNGKMYEAGQGNNFYVFSGIALGSVLCSAHHVTEAMVDEVRRRALSGVLSLPC
jgi:malate dehydrogenase (oxaloacetate-decarboxylating)(NADP+)